MPSILQSQSYYFDNYSVEDGLNSSKVYSLLQDQNDYIWLGTAGGVSRFDGINFEGSLDIMEQSLKYLNRILFNSTQILHQSPKLQQVKFGSQPLGMEQFF